MSDEQKELDPKTERIKIRVEENSEISPSKNDSHNQEKEKDKSLDASVDKNTDVIVKSDEKIPFWIIFISFLLGLTFGAGIIGGFFYYKNRVDVINKNQSPSPIPQETSLPPESTDEPVETTTTASPQSKTIDLKSLSFQVLNGSGIKGEASKIEALLKKGGVTDIKTGNANTYDYKDTQISLAKNINAEAFTLIEKILTGYPCVKSDKTATGFDVIITVGSKKSN